jgi:hypothetical protein
MRSSSLRLNRRMRGPQVPVPRHTRNDVTCRKQDHCGNQQPCWNVVCDAMGSRAAAKQHKSAGQPREGKSESGKGTRAGISRFECIEEAEPVAVSFMSEVAIHRLTGPKPTSHYKSSCRAGVFPASGVPDCQAAPPAGGTGNCWSQRLSTSIDPARPS